MAWFMTADLVSAAPDHLVYLFQKGDGGEDTDPQEVWVPIDENGGYCGDGQVVTLSGEKVWPGTSAMFGKLLFTYRKSGEWPKKTGLCAG